MLRFLRAPFLQSLAFVILSVSAVYAVGSMMAMSPSHKQWENLFWPSAGFAFTGLWWFGKRALVGVILGAILVGLFTAPASKAVLILPLAWGPAALIGVWWLRREGVADIFTGAHAIFQFILVAVLIAPISGATLAAALFWLDEPKTGAALAQAWLDWWLSNSIGMLLVAPFLLSWRHFRLIELSPVQLLELTVVGMLLVGLWLHFLMVSVPSSAVLLFLIPAVALVIWVSIRCSITMVTSVLLMIALFALYSTSAGYGPFVHAGLPENSGYLYGFLCVLTSIGLWFGVNSARIRSDGRALATVAPLVADSELDRRHFPGTALAANTLSQTKASLRISNAHLLKAQRIAHLGSWEWDRLANRFTGSDEVCRILGLEPGSARDFAKVEELIHPDDRKSRRRAWEIACTYPNHEYETEFRIIRPDGEQRFIHSKGDIIYDDCNRPVLAIGVLQDVTEVKQYQAKIERLAYFDELTGLPNRCLFRERLMQSMADAVDDRRQVALLVVDIDHFKALNDAHGHDAGDRLIEWAAQRIARCVGDNGMAARMGGDEFSVILPALPANPATARASAMAWAETLRGRLGEPFEFGDHVFYSGASIGAALYPDEAPEKTLQDLLMQAETALYHAKDNGRNASCLFEKHMQDAVAERLAIEQDLREALNKSELQLYLQPQFDGGGMLVGAECLLRWHHSERGPIPPATFIPIAENTGLIVSIGKWVLQQSCMLIARLAVMKRDLRIAINVSPRQFRQHDFVALVEACLHATGVDPQFLVIEITENVVVDNVNEVIARMSELKRLGVRFSIDDFGTGYSSLSYLKHLPIRELKIDKSFVDGLPNDPDDSAIVGSILALAQNLNLAVVAEGIETEAQWDYLKARGCKEFQGYWLGKPIPAATFIEQCLAEQGR